MLEGVRVLDLSRVIAGPYCAMMLARLQPPLLPDPSAHYFASGVRPQRVGNRNSNVTPAEAFRAADGFINVVILNPDQYAKFCKALGDEALVVEDESVPSARSNWSISSDESRNFSSTSSPFRRAWPTLTAPRSRDSWEALLRHLVAGGVAVRIP